MVLNFTKSSSANCIRKKYHPNCSLTVFTPAASTPPPSSSAAFVDAYMKILEYFKPKQARTVHAGEQDAPVQITISDKI